jgi:aminoglycoside phosphotransferase (APT) family kinase protein
VSPGGPLEPAQVDRLAGWLQVHAGIDGVRVTRALSGGNANLTLLLDSDSGPLVLRTPPAATVSPKAYRGIQREATVLRAITGRVRAPQVIAWCDDVEVLGRPFLLVSHEHGVSVTDTLPGTYADSAATVNCLGEALIDELAVIHCLPWASIGLADFGRPEHFLRRQIERWRDIRAQTAVRELPQLASLGEWLLAHVPGSGAVSLVHGDYHLDNTLVDPDRPVLSAVIDWELATIGDPLSDLGLFLMFWGPRRADPPGFQYIQAVTRRPGVLSRGALAERWAEATGIGIDALDFYLAFAFWRLAAIVEGAYCLYRQGRVDSAYARGLENDVPALLAEAGEAAVGRW